MNFIGAIVLTAIGLILAVVGAVITGNDRTSLSGLAIALCGFVLIAIQSAADQIVAEIRELDKGDASS